jgi:hypothetical protein
MFYADQVEWVRAWTYQLRWAAGHSGVRSRSVDSLAKLRAVVEWARQNPNVEKCSYTVTYAARGPQIEACPAGHSLRSPREWQPYQTHQRMRSVQCRACPGHYRTICPTCNVAVYDPPLTVGCGPTRD